MSPRRASRLAWSTFAVALLLTALGFVLSGELRAAVAQTMQPAHVSLWLRGGEAGR